jgi:hypothetical protein
VGGEYGRWLIFQICTRYQTRKSRGNYLENVSARRHERYLFFGGSLGPPSPALDVMGDLDSEENRDGRIGFDLGGAYGMRRRDRRATA